MRKILLLLILMSSCEGLFYDVYIESMLIANDTNYSLFIAFDGYGRKLHSEVGFFDESNCYMAENHSDFSSKYNWSKTVKDSVSFYVYDCPPALEEIIKAKGFLSTKDVEDFRTNDSLVGTLILTHHDLKKCWKFHFPPTEYGHVVFNPDNEHGRQLLEASKEQ